MEVLKALKVLSPLKHSRSSRPSAMVAISAIAAEMDLTRNLRVYMSRWHLFHLLPLEPKGLHVYVTVQMAFAATAAISVIASMLPSGNVNRKVYISNSRPPS
jgi:hypothetical protein